MAQSEPKRVGDLVNNTNIQLYMCIYLENQRYNWYK